MRKIALLVCLAMVLMASLAFGSVAFGDDGGGSHSQHCEYEHGHWQCES